MESVEQSIKDLEGIVDVTETMRNFNTLKYEEAQEYTPERIVHLRIASSNETPCFSVFARFLSSSHSNFIEKHRLIYSIFKRYEYQYNKI